jgi:hypothetical protein
MRCTAALSRREAIMPIAATATTPPAKMSPSQMSPERARFFMRRTSRPAAGRLFQAIVL